MRRGALSLLLGALLWGTLARAQAAGPSIGLSWTFQQDAVNPATFFVVERCVQLTSGCTYADLAGAAQVPVATMTYTDTAIQQNITYCYRVRPGNSFGRGNPSGSACGVLGGPPSTVPQNLTLKLNPATS